MKNTILVTTLLCGAVLGLSACGGGGGGGTSAFNTFDGLWQQSTDCTSVLGNSFKITEVNIKGADVVSTINAYSELNCTGVDPISVQVVSEFKYGKEDVPVAECKDGKATEVDITLQSVSAPILPQPITGDSNIRTLLESQGVTTALPAYTLLCLANNGDILLTGDVSGDKDGSSANDRPDSMDLTNTLIPK